MPIRVIITSTGRNSMKDKPSIFDEETKLFKNREDALKFIKEKYGKVKTRKPMYVDDKKGKIQKIGYIFGFWNEDISHPYTEEGKKNRWYQEDWVELREEKYSPIKW